MSKILTKYSIFNRRSKVAQKGTQKAGQRHRRSKMEGLRYATLEDRKMLAVGVVTSGAISFNPATSVLRLQGTDDVADQVFVSTPNDQEIRINFNGEFSIFDRSEISQIRFTGLGGDDLFNGALSDVDTVVLGGVGNDRLVGGGGIDRLVGGAGDDTLIGGGADDFILGGSGDDVIFGGEGDDQLSGGNENDSLVGGFGDDILIGGNGDDRLEGSDGNDGLFGGNDNDSIFGQVGNDRINGNAGDDFINGGANNDLIQGGLGNDRILGGAGADSIFGFDGDDLISGEGGDDRIFGGEGDDAIDGGGGDDTIVGDAGSDSLSGGQGADLIFGGSGNDDIRGGSGNDLLFGQFGSDAIFGDAGDDQVVGNQGSDFLSGGSGNDFISGGSGQDRLFGGAGSDDLRGGAGADGIFGGTGAIDRIAGDEGADRLIIVGSETVIDAQSDDAQVIFRDGSSRWTDQEIAVIDQGLQRLQARLGNNQLAIDPLFDRPIVFVKEATLPPVVSLAQTNAVEVVTSVFNDQTGLFEETVEFERQYVFADWDESDVAQNALRSLEVPRAIAISWASTEAIEAVLPQFAEVFNRFMAVSSWQDGPGGDFFRVSEDNSSFYREDALFADETGRINATQDWASAWQLEFTPNAEAAQAEQFAKLNVLDQLFDNLAS